MADHVDSCRARTTAHSTTVRSSQNRRNGMRLRVRSRRRRGSGRQRGNSCRTHRSVASRVGILLSFGQRRRRRTARRWRDLESERVEDRARALRGPRPVGTALEHSAERERLKLVYEDEIERDCLGEGCVSARRRRFEKANAVQRTWRRTASRGPSPCVFQFPVGVCSTCLGWWGLAASIVPDPSC